MLGGLNQLTAEDLGELRRLIEISGLDASDLGTCNLDYFVGIKEDNNLVAAGGIEVFKGSGLLRSIATLPEYRRRGLALKIVSKLELLAIDCDIEDLYLLTETASNFFAKLGYQRTDRSTASDAITSTAQFSSLCPDSAILMKKKIAST